MTSPDRSNRLEGERAMRSILEEQATGWNNGDAELYARSFAAAGTFTNIFGANYVTKESVRERMAEIFKTAFKQSRITLALRRLEFLASDIAVADIDAEVTGYRAHAPGSSTGDGPMRTKMLQVLRREKHEWQVVALQNTRVVSAPF
jgi:uncharacterized protein (TIGR02246 family)